MSRALADQNFDPPLLRHSRNEKIREARGITAGIGRLCEQVDRSTFGTGALGVSAIWLRTGGGQDFQRREECQQHTVCHCLLRADEGGGRSIAGGAGEHGRGTEGDEATRAGEPGDCAAISSRPHGEGTAGTIPGGSGAARRDRAAHHPQVGDAAVAPSSGADA
jgi:hypothetical protein